MKNKFDDMTAVEIRAMIKALVEELDNRELRQFEALTAAYRAGLKDSGYTDDQVSTPEKIRELMINMDNNKIRVSDYATKQTRSVKPKYRHPKTKEEWAGRGAFAPPWVARVMEEKGWTLQEFKNSSEFKINIHKNKSSK